MNINGNIFIFSNISINHTEINVNISNTFKNSISSNNNKKKNNSNIKYAASTSVY